MSKSSYASIVVHNMEFAEEMLKTLSADFVCLRASKLADVYVLTMVKREKAGGTDLKEKILGLGLARYLTDAQKDVGKIPTE